MAFGCSSSPRTVLDAQTATELAEMMYGYLQNYDYDSYTEGLLVEDVDEPHLKKKTLKMVVQAMYDDKLRSKGGITDFNVIRELYNPESYVSVVQIEVTYGDGTVEERSERYFKNLDGIWKYRML